MISDGRHRGVSWAGGQPVTVRRRRRTFRHRLCSLNTMTIGQAININRAVTFNPATPTGNGTQTGTIVLYVTRVCYSTCRVPIPTRAKFTINTTTTLPDWLDRSECAHHRLGRSGVGLNCGEISDTTTVMGFQHHQQHDDGGPLWCSRDRWFCNNEGRTVCALFTGRQIISVAKSCFGDGSGGFYLFICFLDRLALGAGHLAVGCCGFPSCLVLCLPCSHASGFALAERAGGFAPCSIRAAGWR